MDILPSSFDPIAPPAPGLATAVLAQPAAAALGGWDAVLAAAQARAAPHGGRLAVACVVLNEAHGLAHRFGYARAEQMMEGAADRLRAALRPGDQLFSLRPHVFAVLMEQVDGTADAEARGSELLAALARRIEAHGCSGSLSGRLGLAVSTGDAPCEDLLRRADLALAEADAHQHGRPVLYCERMDAGLRERARQSEALWHALEQDRLLLAYAPIADLATGALRQMAAVLCEAGADGSAPQVLSPLSTLDEPLLAQSAARWAVRQLCQQLAAWRTAQAPVCQAALALPHAAWQQPGFAAWLSATLEAGGVPPSALTLELEWNSSAPSAAALAPLQALAATGCPIALDAPSSYAASPALLARFPFRYLKIPADFVHGIVEQPTAAATVEDILALGQRHQAAVVAEEVVTEGQLRFLAEHQCGLVQGPLIGAPLAPAELEARGWPQPVLPATPQPSGRTLLLVDDEQNILSALKRLLRRDGYQILTANGGRAALELLAQHEVDVIVSDQRMPEMLGVDFLRAAKSLYPDTVRIMLSGYTELQSVTSAVNEGAIYKFLTKPWDDECLRGHIAEAFRAKEAADDNVRLNRELRRANQQLALANSRMEDLLSQKQEQLRVGEISLNVAQEVLQAVCLPVLGVDDGGLVVFSNPAADTLFAPLGGALGRDLGGVLPDLSGDDDAADMPRCVSVRLDGHLFRAAVHPMGSRSASRGCLLVLSPEGSDAAPDAQAARIATGLAGQGQAADQAHRTTPIIAGPQGVEA